MGFSGSGGLAASSSNCCCGRRGGRRRVSHSKKRSHPCPHETLCGAVTEGETAMVGDFLRDTGRLGLGRDGEREESSQQPRHASAALACPRHRPCARGSVCFRHGG